MKAQRVIQHRDQSAPAICLHRDDVGMRDCVNQCHLIVTPSPLREWRTLVVDRCPQHLVACYGVIE